MSTTEVVVVLLFFASPLFPPIIGLVAGAVYDVLTARHLRERRSATARPGVRRPVLEPR